MFDARGELSFPGAACQRQNLSPIGSGVGGYRVFADRQLCAALEAALESQNGPFTWNLRIVPPRPGLWILL